MGVLIFSLKKPKKFGPFARIFQRPTKNEPLRFHFLKGVDKNLRVQIPVIFGERGGGGAGKKKTEHPNGSLCPNQTDTSAMIQHLKHE